MTHRIAASLVALLGLAGLFAPPLSAQATCEDVSGIWVVELDLPGSGTSQVTLTLEQTECAVAGLVEGRNRTEIQDGTVEGWTATFTAVATNQGSGGGMAIAWEVTVEGDEIEGTLNAPMMGTVEFTGTRVEGSAEGRWGSARSRADRAALYPAPPGPRGGNPGALAAPRARVHDSALGATSPPDPFCR